MPNDFRWVVRRLDQGTGDYVFEASYQTKEDANDHVSRLEAVGVTAYSWYV